MSGENDPGPQVRVGNPATYDPAINGGNNGDVVVQPGADLRGAFGLISNAGGTLRVSRLVPLVAVAAVESVIGTGVENLRVNATNANGANVPAATFLVTLSSNNDPLTVVVVGATGLLLFVLGVGADQVLAVVRAADPAGTVDLRVTGTVGDEVSYQVWCLDSPSNVVVDSYTVPA